MTRSVLKVVAVESASKDRWAAAISKYAVSLSVITDAGPYLVTGEHWLRSLIPVGNIRFEFGFPDSHCLAARYRRQSGSMGQKALMARHPVRGPGFRAPVAKRYVIA